MDEDLLEETRHYEALLRIQRRNLRALELQAARHGPLAVPLPIQSAQDELRAEIARVERALRALRGRMASARGAAGHPSIERQICLFATADLAATGRFYERTIGLRLAFERADRRVYSLIEGAYLGFCLELADPRLPAWPIITIVTTEVDAWHTYLAARGAPTDGPPRPDERHTICYFFVQDPNGYRIEVRQMLIDE